MKLTQKMDIEYSAQYVAKAREISQELMNAVRDNNLQYDESYKIESIYDRLNGALAVLEYRISKLVESIEE